MALYVKYVSEALIKDSEGEKGAFKSILLPGIGSISANSNQVYPCTKKDGTVIAGLYNVMVGREGTVRKVSREKLTKAGKPYATRKFETIEMTAEDIVKAWTESRKAYRAAQKAEADAE